jgi:hypothetical protein
MAVEARFEGELTPPPEAVFSPITFTNRGLDEDYNPIQPSTAFTNPVGHLYGVFSYARMEPDVQWSALWHRDGELVHYETLPWDGGSGGIGYTEWNPAPEAWQPGRYTVTLFLGTDWYVTGAFVVEGTPPTSTPTLTPSPTLIPSPTWTPSPTITPSPTRTLTPSPPPPTPTGS